MKVIVAGGRKFYNYDLVKSTLLRLLEEFPQFEVVSGGAFGADKLGERFAVEHGLKIHQFIPDWTIGKSAGFIRNKQMPNFGDALVAFWDGKSPGTRNMIQLAKDRDLLVKIVRY